MKFLIDTNIFIPLEPSSPSDLEKLSGLVTDFVKLVELEGHQIYIHPESLLDITNDKDENRKFLRTQFFKKYPSIPEPPSISAEIDPLPVN